MTTTTLTDFHTGLDLRGKLKSFWATTVAAMTNYAELRSRSSQMIALQNKSDVQLMDQHGIRRDQIAYYVFRDMMYC